MPKRIQRSRKKGWRMPEGAVYVGRPTPWGNPFAVGRAYVQNTVVNGRVIARETLSPLTPSDAKFLYRDHLLIRLRLDSAWDFLIPPLVGRDLACWCPLDQPCHADVLLELANRQGDR